MSKAIYDEILSWEGNSDTKRYLVSPRNIQTFFTDGRQLIRVPDYQRPYSWSKENITDLLNDIYRISQSENQSSSWFLGPVFTVKRSTEDKYTDLLDGQQRLTTIQILLRESTLIEFSQPGIDVEHDEIKDKLSKIKRNCNACITKEHNMETIARFSTEESLNEAFHEYIIGFENINSIQQLELKRREYEMELKRQIEGGSPSALTLLNSINIIREFIRVKFIKRYQNDTIGTIKSFYEFVQALLLNCWLIEIPLQNHKDSIQIFESLNNRGKPLTLVDKIRYRCLTKCTDESIILIRKKWKRIYSGLNYAQENSYLKSEDDFFKVYFNSHEGEDKTKEEAILKYFEDSFLTNEDYIHKFLDESIRILEFFETIHTCLNIDNSFVSTSFNNDESRKVKALLRLLNRALQISDNSRLILFHALCKYNTETRNDKIKLTQSLWNLIRFVFYNEIYRDKKSQVVRTYYLGLIKRSLKNEFYFHEDLEINSYNFNRTFIHVIQTKDNNLAKFILYLYAYLNEYESLFTYGADQYKKEELEHFMPRKWKKHWSKYRYKTAVVLDYLKDEVPAKQPNHSSIVKVNNLIDEIDACENFELNEDQKVQEESLIEWIGNKWVLHDSSNATIGNHGFDKKKEKYQDERYVKIPRNQADIGINNYEEFTYKQILSRSIAITALIVSGYRKKWNDIS